MELTFFSSTAFFKNGGLSWDKAANWLAENQFIHFIPTKDAILIVFSSHAMAAY